MGYEYFDLGQNHIISNPNFPSAIIGGIRVDGEKIFFIRTADSTAVQGYPINYASEFPLGTEKMIYDFDIKIGDTLHWKSDTENVVLAIDTTSMCDGRKVKRYRFNLIPPDYNAKANYWIEGIGSSISPLGQEKYSYTHDGMHYTQLLCYYNDDYCFSRQMPQQKGCFYIPPTAVGNIENIKPGITLVNPVERDLLEINSSDRISSIVIIDINGKEKFRSNQVLEAGQHQLPVQLEPGLYFIRVQFSNGSTDQKKLIRL